MKEMVSLEEFAQYLFFFPLFRRNLTANLIKNKQDFKK